MEALTEPGRGGWWLDEIWKVVVLGSLACFATASCVGEESRPGEDEPQEEIIELPFDPDEVRSGVFVDSAGTVEYHTFESTVVSESPRKMFFRVMALELGEPEELSKTLRLALDSIARADSSLVATRATLYTFRPTGPRRGVLTAQVWGEWSPPVGWEEAGTEADTGSAPNRIYLYDRQPGWYESLSGGS